MNRLRVLILMLACAQLPEVAEAQWGRLAGRIVVDGKPPSPVEILASNDAFCQEAKLVDQHVLVGEAGGLQNAVVYLRTKRSESVVVHPSYQAMAEEPVTLANRGCCFSPRITLLRTGQPLVVTNADPTAHNTKFDLVRNEPVNSVIAAKKEFTTKFGTEESLPVAVSCNIHPFMRGYLLVRDNPYMVVTDEHGAFEIENLPIGEHQFQFWHETGYLKHASFASGDADRRGRVRLTILDGQTLELGDIRVPAELLAR